MEGHTSSQRIYIAYERVESRRTVYNCCNGKEMEKAKPGSRQSRSSGSKSWNSKVGVDVGSTDRFFFSFLLLIKLTLSSQCPTYCNRILTTLLSGQFALSLFFLLIYSFLFPLWIVPIEFVANDIVRLQQSLLIQLNDIRVKKWKSVRTSWW